MRRWAELTLPIFPHSTPISSLYTWLISLYPVLVSVGTVVELEFTLKMTPVAEEIVVTAPSPVVDVQSSKLALTVSADLLANVPMARDLYDVVNSAPGAISEGVSYRRTSSIHGSTVRQNVYAFDGAGMNDPMVGYPITNINFDVMQEVEVSLAGHPAEVGFAEGGYINIVTKSGGNRYSGGLTFYYTREQWGQNLFPKEMLKALGVEAPRFNIFNYDLSGALGGPIIKDKIWFFGNARALGYKDKGTFIPFTDPTGVYHGPWDFEHYENMGFFKLTTQLSEKLRAFGMVNFTQIYRPSYSEPTWNFPFNWTRVWDHEKGIAGTFMANYIINKNTVLDLKGWYVGRLFPLMVRKGMEGIPFYYDSYTGRYWGSGYYNEEYWRRRLQGGIYLTRYQDNFLGANHEFKAGVEFEDSYADTEYWKENPLRWYYYDGHYLRWPALKRGYLAFGVYPRNKGEANAIQKGRRASLFLQDSIDFGRLNINAGIRWDYSTSWEPAQKKGRTPSDLAFYIGETVMKPAYGINPYAEMEWPEWKDIITYNNISPRLGLTYDLFGNGKTALKTSYNIYHEYLILVYLPNPASPFNFTFHWYDDNGNKTPDIGDRFTHVGTSPIVMLPEYQKARIDPNIKAPTTREFIFGVQHELIRDFSITLNFIHKKKDNIVEDVRWDAINNRPWNTYENAPEWWIPFDVIVPAYDIFPERRFTIYAQRLGAPSIVWRMTNVPELVRKYQAIELIFNKRMSNRWQLSGSIVWSKFYGNIDAMYWDSDGWTAAGDSPNYFVNRYGRLNADSPLVIKLMGTVVLPYDINLSAYYRYFDGSPWGRSVTVYLPSKWMSANNADPAYGYWSVLVEPPGTRRTQSFNYLDVRVEKEFKLGRFGKLGVYFDAFNLLGFSRVFISQNPGGEWYPVDANTSSGTYKVSGTYKKVTGVSGQRQVKLSIRYSF